MPALPFDQHLAWIIAAAIGVVVILAILRRFRLPERLPYKKVDSLLTPAERVFDTALLAAVGNAPISVLAKVRLADLVVIPKGTPEPQRHRGRVQSKHIDFVLCDRSTLAPLLVIELVTPRATAGVIARRPWATSNHPIQEARRIFSCPVALRGPR